LTLKPDKKQAKLKVVIDEAKKAGIPSRLPLPFTPRFPTSRTI